MAHKRRQSLECHACGGIVEFTIDFDLDGNHVFTCPNCKHEHCRVVKDGRITGERWDQRNNTYVACYVTWTSATITTSGSYYVYYTYA